MSKKIIILIVMAAVVAAAAYIYFYTDLIVKHYAENWSKMNDDEKIKEFEYFLQHGGSVYFRPGSQQLAEYLSEMMAIYQANHLTWPQEQVDAILAANNVLYSITNRPGLDDPLTPPASYDPLAALSITNRPGTGYPTITDRPGL
jgi:hypothetical protein